MYFFAYCTVLVCVAFVHAVPAKSGRKSNKLKDDVLSENSLEYFGFPFPPNFPQSDAVIDAELTSLNITERISNVTEESSGSGDEVAYANSTKVSILNSSLIFNSTEDSFNNSSNITTIQNSTDLSFHNFSNISSVLNFTESSFVNASEGSFANSSSVINSTEEFFANSTEEFSANSSTVFSANSSTVFHANSTIVHANSSTEFNSTDASFINSTSSSTVVLKLFLTNDNDTDENIKDEIIASNSTFYNTTTTATATKNGTTIVFGNSTKQPKITNRSSGRTRVGLILASTTTPSSPTVDLAHLKLCSINASQDEKINLTCQWATSRGKQLKVWPTHTTVSMCTALTIKVKHCQSLCEQYDECLSIHFCRECVEYNCRLLTDKTNSSSVLNLTNEYPYVDYHEKVQC